MLLVGATANSARSRELALIVRKDLFWIQMVHASHLKTDS